MTILALGLNHESAPLAVREQIAFAGDSLLSALGDLSQRVGISEVAILSTCNRTEVYCRTEPNALQAPAEWLHGYHQLDPGALDPFLYRHNNEAAVRHMLRVATGLDSMVLGEPEILGQMKSAHQLARDAATVDSSLDRLFQHAFATAKKVRTTTAIGERPVSVASTAVTMARRLFGEFSSQTVLLIGAGETMELAARHLAAQGVKHLLVANRTLSKAQELANRFSGSAVTLDALPEHLAKADVIFSSTSASGHVLSRADLAAATKQRKRRPVFVVDLAVPRDVEPAAADLPDVYLYTIDTIQQAAEDGRQSRRLAAREAEHLIEHQVDQFMIWLQAQKATQVIRHYRQRAEGWREQELARARQQIAGGKPTDEVLSRLAHNLTQRLLHGPSTRLRQAAGAGRLDLLEAARDLLDLSPAESGAADQDNRATENNVNDKDDDASFNS